MLTVDLVHATRRGDRLHVTKLRGARLRRAVELAELMIAELRVGAGEMRGELTQRLHGLESSNRERKLVRGLARLLLQRCTFEAVSGVEPIALRRSLFREAAQRRKAGALDRDALIESIAAQHELTAQQLESSLFADLKHTHRLSSFEPLDATALVDTYQLAQSQAVLLRATLIEVSVKSRDPQSYRRLFQRLKFHQLLWRSERTEDGFQLTIDGPMALFSQSTRYGLQLALLLPVIREIDRWSLTAQVRWGKTRQPLRFELEGRGTRGNDRFRLADDVQRLLDDLNALKGPWRCEPSSEFFDVPGAGVVVPDLRLSRPGAPAVHVEVLGYWSRPAVWRRVELVQAGLLAPFVFVLSSRLRVSEEVLGDDVPAALCVYKGVISARAVLQRAEQVATSGA